MANKNKAVDFVVVVVVVVSVIVVTLLVVTSHFIFRFGQVNLRPLKAKVEFLWWGGVGGVCTVIFMSNPTTVLRLCCDCIVVGL